MSNSSTACSRGVRERTFPAQLKCLELVSYCNWPQEMIGLVLPAERLSNERKRAQVLDIEGLCQVIIGTKIQMLNDVLHLVLGTDNQNGDIVILAPQVFQDGLAVQDQGASNPAVSRRVCVSRN